MVKIYIVAERLDILHLSEIQKFYHRIEIDNA